MIEQQEGYIRMELGGESRLLPYGQKIADQQKGITLNEAGTLIWDALTTPKSRDELARLLETHYQAETDDEREMIAKDTEAFLNQLLAVGVIRENNLEPGQPLAAEMEIAGLKIALYGAKELIPEQFGLFSKKNENDSVSPSQQIEIINASPSNHPNGTILLRNRELTVCRTKSGYVVFFPSMKQITEAHMTEDGSRVQIYGNFQNQKEDRENLFHAIRLFVLYALQKRGFFAVHSASILYQGKAWLFSGHSGMGKSTHTNLWHRLLQVPLLNGDLNLLGYQNGVLSAVGIPWCGTSEITTEATYPLGGIVLLGRAKDDHLEPLTEREKALRVMQRMISPAWTAEQMQQNLAFAKQLAGAIPVYYLLCTPTPNAVYTIKEAIDRGNAENESCETTAETAAGTTETGSAALDHAETNGREPAYSLAEAGGEEQA